MISCGDTGRSQCRALLSLMLTTIDTVAALKDLDDYGGRGEVSGKLQFPYFV